MRFEITIAVSPAGICHWPKAQGLEPNPDLSFGHAENSIQMLYENLRVSIHACIFSYSLQFLH